MLVTDVVVANELDASRYRRRGARTRHGPIQGETKKEAVNLALQFYVDRQEWAARIAQPPVRGRTAREAGGPPPATTSGTALSQRRHTRPARRWSSRRSGKSSCDLTSGNPVETIRARRAVRVIAAGVLACADVPGAHDTRLCPRAAGRVTVVRRTDLTREMRSCRRPGGRSPVRCRHLRWPSALLMAA